MSSRFRVGITRDILDSRGEPAFGQAALAVLQHAPSLEWEYLPGIVSELTPEHAARYDAIYVNMARTPAAAVAQPDVRLRVVARHGVGYDSVDVPAMTSAGVIPMRCWPIWRNRLSNGSICLLSLCNNWRKPPMGKCQASCAKSTRRVSSCKSPRPLSNGFDRPTVVCKITTVPPKRMSRPLYSCRPLWMSGPHCPPLGGRLRTRRFIFWIAPGN